MASNPGLLISEILTNPNGNDSPFEYVELIATQNIDFSVTPYSVVFANNGTATTNGWIAGGAITYGFNITSGTVKAGDVVYVGGSSMTPTGTKLRTINTGRTAGDRFGSASPGGVLGNGGANADAVVVFAADINTITNSTVPVDALFFGTGAGSAVVSSGTAGYELPVNDRYSGGKLQNNSFLAGDPAADQVITATGTYDPTTNTFTTPRTWTLGTASDKVSSITLASTPTGQPDLTISQTDSPDPVAIGGALTYTLSVTNTGNANASGVDVQYTLPTGINFLNAAGTGFTVNQSNGVVTFTGGSINAGSSALLTVIVQTTAAGTLTSGTAVVDPSNTITESNETNNTAGSITTTVASGNASLVTTITVPGNATDLFPLNGGNGGANINRLGGFGSDFFYDYRTGFYYGLVDRGPGGGTIPYQTRVEKIALTIDPNTGAASGFQVVQTIPFYIPAGTTLNGVTYTTDTPFNGLNSKQLADGNNGSLLAESQDPEGFVVGANGNFFVSDEYGPSIYEFEPTGKFVRAFTPPSNVIPKLSGSPYYAADVASTTGRQDNRGYEGLAISPDGTKLFAVFQDPLQEEGSANGRSSRNVRIVRYDVATGQSDAQYIYQLESLSAINDRIPGTTNDFGATAQGRNIGISSLVALNNTQLLVLERDNRGVGVDPASNLPIGSKRVYQIDLTGATDVSSISLAGSNTLPAGVTPVSKSLFLDIAGAIQGAGQTVPEKIEGLAIGPQLADGSFALLVATDNDFSVTQNGSNVQFDVYTDYTQQAIDSAPPSSGATLFPSYIYSFKTQAGALDLTPVFDFSTTNYSVTEGNTPGFSTNATVRIIRRGDLSGTDSVQLKLSDGTATGSGLSAPVQNTVQGPSTGSTPYILPVASGVKVISLLTTDNTGTKPDDTAPKVGGGTYGMDGIPDGLGAFDNGDGTFTVLMNHELGNTNGVVRDHGAKGAYVSKFVIDKSTLQVVSGEDLIKQIYGWNSTTQSVDTTAPITLAINRFCSADLPAVTAFYNPNTGLGSQARIFMNGEEGGATGYQFATVVTGADAGKAYVLGKFNLTTNSSGLTGVGAWENALANPYAQDKTIVIGNNDGGTGIMNNAVAVYVGTKQSTGTEVDKAGLTNGILKFISVAGNSAEIANATTRATNITSGTRFTLSSTASTTFSRPEDGAWNPLDPRQYFFATTDRIDQVSDGVGTQIGQTRLWRLTFDDITNPDAGGTIDLLVDGDTVNGVKVNMFDNITIDKYGHILLQEDVGGAAHNGKIWQYDIATDTLKQIAKHDPARFGDIGVAATSPFNNDEESSGIIDVQDILGPGWFLTSDQAHYTTGITTSQVEGGQLLAIFSPDTYNAAIDYNNTPITVTFNPGETYKDVQIPIAGDFTPEANETVNLSLANPSAGTVIGTKQSQAVLTIVNDDAAPSARIHDIQGAAHRSPLEGQNVTNVPGIVTALASNGFYLQDPNLDNDDRTSEGIFVFTSSAPTVAVGDYIQVSGKVSEFRPGNNANNLTTTEIINPTINKLSSGNALPAATILGNGGRTIPTTVIENDATNVETTGTFDPASDGIDFYESLEGMRVQINNPVATSPTNDFSEVWVLADNGVNATSKTARGGSLINQTDFNPERIQIDDNLFSGGTPNVSVGAKFGTIVGVVDYNFNNYEVLPTTAPTVVTPSTLTKEVTNLTGTTSQLTVATFNVENLDPGDGATKFNNLASRIVNNLKSPDIISLEEIQDNNGATNDSVVDASVTYQTLINAIASAGGPTYQYRQINPVDDTNGGEPGGNIRVGFLFNPNRVSFVDRPGGTSTSNTTVTNVEGNPTFSASPGLVDPTNPAFNSSRKPLVGEFSFNGQTVYVVGNHFNSKGGDQPLYGPNQPPILSSETQRQQQATIVKNFVQSILAINPNANVLVAGDLNDFEFSNPLNTLKSAGLKALIETLPQNERYTYNFEGNAQTLDHILVSSNLLSKLDGYDVVHINSEFYDQDSDHDPSVARFNLPANQPPMAVNLNNSISSINENSDTSNRIKVAEIVITDDTLGTNNFSLSGTDASFFEIDNSVVYLKAGTNLNYETKSSYNITVAVDDPTVGNTPDATTSFSLAVTDVNEAPTAINFANTKTSIDENSNTGSRIKVAEIAIADDALGTNNLSLGGTDASFFEIDNSVVYLKAGTNLDYETKSNYNVTVAVDDPTVGNSPDVTANFTLAVNDVNEAPVAKNDSANTTDIQPVTINVLANDSDPENDPLSISNFTNPSGGTVVKNQDNTFTYTPDIGFFGSDNFAYTVSDGKGLTGTATVNLNVTRVSTGIFGTLSKDNLTGTNQNDLIGGLAGDDLLKGGNGDDTIYGGLGNDSLNGENGNDILYGNHGNDSLDGGNGNDTLYGDSGNDTLIGGNGDDILVGGKGSDFLTGGNGSDRFYLTGNGTGEFDTIGDFAHGVDAIVISKSEFGLSQALGILDPSLFRSGTTSTTASDRFIYDRTGGNLFFDVDGTGSTAQFKIAQLTNKATLTSTDFTVIA